jgi:antitoxin component YwqK of YwqJK toxin-antitoxin module
MKNSIFLFSLFFSAFLFSQNKIDENGKKQGPWKKTHPKSSAIQYEGQFKNDKPIGTFYYYYTSKSKQAIIKHEENSNKSSATFFHENGIILSKGNYIDMKKDSIWLNFAPSGRLSSSETYKKDILNGIKIIYYLPEDFNDKTQRKMSVSNYIEGKLNGEKIEYFESGIIKSKGTYINNVKNGVWETNHPNGKVMNQERFKNGELHGWCIAKDENGVETGRIYFYYGERLEGKKLELKMKQFKELGINPNN